MLFMVERKVSDMLNANLINKAAKYYRGIKLFNRLPFTIKFMAHNYLRQHYTIS